MLLVGLLVPLTVCLVLAVWALGLSSQKIMALGILLCLTAVYWLLVTGPMGMLGLIGVAGFWPGVVLVLVGVFGKNGKRVDKEETGEDDAL